MTADPPRPARDEVVERLEAKLTDFYGDLPAGARATVQIGALRHVLARLAQAERRAEEAERVVAERKPLRMLQPVGQTVDEWRAHAQRSELYRVGDATLVWVNEGDLWLAEMEGRVQMERRAAALTAGAEGTGGAK